MPEAVGPAFAIRLYFTKMCSGSEAGSYSRLIDSVYHSTLGLIVIKKKVVLPEAFGPASAISL